MIKVESAILHPDLPISQCIVKQFVNFVCQELKVSPRSITLSSYDTGDHILGMCIDETPEDFIILVKETERNLTEVFVTIAHELIHVKQFMKENLGWFLDNRYTIPYYDRWWEQEAYRLSVPLVEKFTKTL